MEARQTSKLQNRRRPLFDVELYLTVHKSFVSTSLNNKPIWFTLPNEFCRRFFSLEMWSNEWNSKDLVLEFNTSKKRLYFICNQYSSETEYRQQNCKCEPWGFIRGSWLLYYTKIQWAQSISPGPYHRYFIYTR